MRTNGEWLVVPLETLEDEESGFLKDGWFSIVAHVSVEDKDNTSPPKDPVSPRNSYISDDDNDPKCIYCLVNSQTSGVLHGATYSCLFW